MSTRSVSPPKGLKKPSSPVPGEDETTVAASSAPPRPRATAPSRGGVALVRRHVYNALPAVVVGLVAVALWQLLVQSHMVSVLFLPAPATVVRSFWYALTDPTGSLLGYAGTTLLESILGCALGALVAIPLGYAIAHSRLVAGAAQPYVAASQAMPALAIAPLLGLWLGYSLTPVIVLCALIVFFPMVITTVLGLRTLDTEILDAARVEGAGRIALLRHIELPLASPSILAGLRTSLTLSITGAVVGEFVIGGKGLGELLVVDLQSYNSAGLFAILFTLALLAALLYGAMRLIERRFSYAEATSLL
jgi:NitT/TauT family transport system permease protein